MPRADARNLSQFWSDRSLSGLSLLRADFTTHAFAPHYHEALVVAATESGSAEFTSRGTTDYADASMLLVFNPAEPHAGRMGWSERWRYRSLYVAQPALDAIATGLGIEALPYFTTNMVCDQALVDGFLALHRTLEAGRSPLAERELLYRSFGALFRRHGSGRKRCDTLAADRSLAAGVIGYMSDHHDRDLTLEEMSRHFQRTPYQLIRIFRRTVGLTPHAYLTQLRLNAACRLLRRGVPLAEAATIAGFYDQSAMSRHFKRSYGITPRQYAAAPQRRPMVTTA